MGVSLMRNTFAFTILVTAMVPFLANAEMDDHEVYKSTSSSYKYDIQSKFSEAKYSVDDVYCKKNKSLSEMIIVLKDPNGNKHKQKIAIAGRKYSSKALCLNLKNTYSMGYNGVNFIEGVGVVNGKEFLYGAFGAPNYIGVPPALDTLDKLWITEQYHLAPKNERSNFAIENQLDMDVCQPVEDDDDVYRLVHVRLSGHGDGQAWLTQHIHAGNGNLTFQACVRKFNESRRVSNLALY